VSTIVNVATATRGLVFSGAFAHRGGALETLLCCRGSDSWRDAATGRETLCHKIDKRDAARIGIAASNLFRGEKTRSTARKAASRASTFLVFVPRLKNRPRKIHQFSQALSLGISGGRAFCFSAESRAQSKALARASTSLAGTFFRARRVFEILTQRPIGCDPRRECRA
jgi:hypothetical protein